jgi:ubiquitin C-terminal hydrolase
LDSTNPNSGCDLSKFKLQLARFNRFYDGSKQRDVLDCFTSILDILHAGTKENLITDSINKDDDQCIYSLTQHLFCYTFKQTLQCAACRYLNTSYDQSQLLLLYPTDDTDIKNLLDSYMFPNFKKICNSCELNKYHDKTITFILPPKILTLVINRFNNVAVGYKNKYKVGIDRDVFVNYNKYDLIGSIHHHGNIITSGHYTSNVFYTGSAYTCNDSYIQPLNNIEPSDSVYMVFYAHSDYSAQLIQRMGARSHDTGTGSA